ncbi:hypothetical protein BKA81DRAFT_377014 [Phyllosticta paracitricarpa]
MDVMVMLLFMMTMMRSRRVGGSGPAPGPSEASGKGGKGKKKAERKREQQYQKIRDQKGKQRSDHHQIAGSVVVAMPSSVFLPTTVPISTPPKAARGPDTALPCAAGGNERRADIDREGVRDVPWAGRCRRAALHWPPRPVEMCITHGRSPRYRREAQPQPSQAGQRAIGPFVALWRLASSRRRLSRCRQLAIVVRSFHRPAVRLFGLRRACVYRCCIWTCWGMAVVLMSPWLAGWSSLPQSNERTKRRKEL